jgi:hypothetical protein
MCDRAQYYVEQFRSESILLPTGGSFITAARFGVPTGSESRDGKSYGEWR